MDDEQEFPFDEEKQPLSLFEVLQSADIVERKSLQSLLELSWNSKVLHDTIFEVGPNKVRLSCAKLVLQLRSTYFEEKLSDEPTSQIVQMPDDEPEIFQAFLKYLSTDILDVTYKNIHQLRHLATKYKAPQLAHALTTKILFSVEVNEKNVVTLFQIAQILREDVFRDQALAMITENLKKVADSEDFLNLTIENLCGILEVEGIQMDATELFNNVIRWGKAECKRQNLDDDNINMKKVLEPVLKLRRFDALPPNEYTIAK